MIRLRWLFRWRLRTPEPKDWTCMICHDWRPDTRIGVMSYQVTKFPGGIKVTHNVRYCTDRDPCYEGALRLVGRGGAR